MSESIDISFVILTWNSEKYIKQCLKSYAESIFRDKLSVEFLIVDNGSQDSTVDIIENDIFQGLPPGCSGRLFRLGENLGTTKSRNIALKEAAGRYIAVCDSDTEFLDGSWLEVLGFLDSIETGMLAPCLLYPDRTVQSSVKKFPTLQDKLRKFGKIFLKRQTGSRTDFYDDFPWDRVRTVDTAISACWVFNKVLLGKVGLLDENIYYSPEDIDYCLRIYKNGGKIVYYPNLKIIHHTQQLSHKKPFSRQSISHFFGLLYYFKKHHYLFSRNKLRQRLSL